MSIKEPSTERQPALRRFTVEEYHQLGDLGIFAPEERLELLDGQIYRKFPGGEPRRWTSEEYHRAADAGIFGPEERLELIDGEIYTMSPHRGPHATGVTLAQTALLDVFRAGWVVRVQLPLALGEPTEPEPDVAVVTGKPRDYRDRHPATAVLVVEVADTSLAFDRSTKQPVYAGAGIPEYWIVNLIDRVLEVYRDPDPSAEAYRSVARYAEDEAVSPLAAPGASVAVADLLH
jgi:Uma2 family endonuclease